MKKIFFALNICYRRRLDAARFDRFLQANGFEPVPAIDLSDTVVLWGCAFNEFQEKKSLELARECIRSGKPVFVLEGISEVARQALLHEGVPGDHIFSFLQTDRVNYFFSRGLLWSDVPAQNHYYQTGGPFSIQTGHGCSDNCAYCGDKAIVGDLKSIPFDEILDQVSGGVEAGVPSIELLGDDVGAYGRDIGRTLSELLCAIGTRYPDLPISMREVNVKYLIQDLNHFARALRSVSLQNMVVAFQSGSDRILKRMRRGYTAQGVVDLLSLLDHHQVYYHLHMIVGFPTETCDEFFESMAILKRVNFYSCTLFAYQDRLYTEAAAIEPKVSPEEIQSRFRHAAEEFKDCYKIEWKDDKLQLTTRRIENS